MAVGKDFHSLLRLHGGLSLGYRDIIESDFAAAAGTAYSPPEEGVFRRIVPARTIQILAQCPGVVETFQTSAVTLRLPANTVTDATNDAANGRIFVFKNAGTGDLTIDDDGGTTLFSLPANLTIIALSNNTNTWDFLFDARNTFFDNSTNNFISNNIHDALVELFNKVSISASPGFTWGGSGNISPNTWLLNDTVPSNKTGRNFSLYNGELLQVSVSNATSNTFDIEMYEHDGTTFTLLHTTNVVAARSIEDDVTSVSVTKGKELAIKNVGGASKNPVVQAILTGTVTP